jgi:integrase
MRMLQEWARPRGPWELTTEDLLEWTASKDWSSETRRSVRSSLRGFYTWGLTTSRIGPENPSSGLPAVKPRPPMPRPCDDDVLALALHQAPAREKLMLWLASDCGMRRGEVARVHPRHDVFPDLLRYSMIVHGKGDKPRVIALPEMLGTMLARHGREDGGFLFPGQIDGHLSPSWVGRIVSRRLAEGWTMHTLRHYFATWAYAKEHDLLAVQQQLGHSSPAITQSYIAVPPTAKQRIVDHVAGRLSA